MKTYWLVLLVAVVGLIVLGGCGGHNGQVPPGGGGGIVAAFVGRAVCATCHGAIDAAYGSYNGVPFVPGTVDPSHVFANFTGSAHGQDMRSKGPNNLNVIDGFGGSCRPCHTTGFAEPTGFTSSAETPHLEGIGCEECHGPGNEHAGAPASTNIHKIPNASTTCWDCHLPSYKLLRDFAVILPAGGVSTAAAPPPVNDESLRNTAPGAINPHYRQTPVLLGFFGYNTPQTPGPHGQVQNTCVTCHLNEASDEVHGDGALLPDFQACAPCHGSASAGEALLEFFNEEIDALLIELGGEDPSNPGAPLGRPTGGLIGAFAAANGIDLNSNANPDDPAVRRVKGAINNYMLIIGGEAVHNPPFAEQMLEDAKALVE